MLIIMRTLDETLRLVLPISASIRRFVRGHIGTLDLGLRCHRHTAPEVRGCGMDVFTVYRVKCEHIELQTEIHTKVRNHGEGPY